MEARAVWIYGYVAYESYDEATKRQRDIVIRLKSLFAEKQQWIAHIFCFSLEVWPRREIRVFGRDTFIQPPGRRDIVQHGL
jgi:hypothetical protein